MNQAYRDIILSYDQDPAHFTSWLKCNHREIFDKINQFCGWADSSYPFYQKVGWYIFGYTSFPICPICGSITTKKASCQFQGMLKNPKLLEYCSRNCTFTGEGILEKRKETCLSKYGVENPSQVQSIKDLKKQKSIEKFGTDYPFQSESVKEKSKQTLIANYGVDNISKHQESQDKKVQTFIEHFGVNHPLKCQDVKDKIQATCIKRYGETNPLKVDEFKMKSRQTCLEKYGVEFSLQSDTVKSKSRQTCMEKYGVEFSLQSEDVRLRSKQTCLDRYGVSSTNQVLNIISKIRDTKARKFFISSIQQNSEIEPLFSINEYANNPLNEFQWKCKKCGNIINGEKDKNWFTFVRCDKCYPYLGNRLSNQEFELHIFIESLNLNTNIIYNSRKIIPPKELDVYIPDKHIAIEFDGLFWHSDIMNHDSNYHLTKTEECEKQGIQLIHIFEDEWINKQDIVKSRIRNILGIFDTKIYARKCEIREVDFNTTKEFLNINHIQGSSISKYNIGLYYENVLVSIMTFGSYRKSMGRSHVENEFELIRFCSKLNYHIPGAASKLLNYFIKQYHPIQILSYADRRWSTGNLYNQLGFSLIRQSVPNYWYIKEGSMVREYRFKYRKSELSKYLSNYDSSLTEQQNMILNRYYRIYDCGNLVFQMKL